MLDSFAQRYELCAMFHNEGLPMDRVLYKFATKPFLVIIIIILTISSFKVKKIISGNDHHYTWTQQNWFLAILHLQFNYHWSYTSVINSRNKKQINSRPLDLQKSFK